jgi:DNA polymerase III subunit epsilon
VRLPWRRTRPWPTPDPDVPWRTARFCVVDLETTGLRADADEIVSIGVAEVAEGRITDRTWYRVVRPSRPIGEEAMRIHALTAAELAGAPPIGELIEPLTAYLAGSFFVAHAAWFERGFLDLVLEPLGQRLPDALVDTAALARRLGLANPDGGREPSLEALALRLGLPVHTPHHALGDAMTTALLLLAFGSRLEADRTEVTVGDLLTWSRETRGPTPSSGTERRHQRRRAGRRRRRPPPGSGCAG